MPLIRVKLMEKGSLISRHVSIGRVNSWAGSSFIFCR